MDREIHWFSSMQMVCPHGWALIHNTRNVSRNIKQDEGLCTAYSCKDRGNSTCQILTQLVRVKLMFLKTKKRHDRKHIYLNCCKTEISIIFKSQLREKWLTELGCRKTPCSFQCWFFVFEYITGVSAVIFSVAVMCLASYKHGERHGSCPEELTI